jgi:hypothetical protein
MQKKGLAEKRQVPMSDYKNDNNSHKASAAGELITDAHRQRFGTVFRSGERKQSKFC